MLFPSRKSDMSDELFQFNPIEIYTNSICKILPSARHRAVPLSVQWSRIIGTKVEILDPVDLLTYICTPFDLGCQIEAKIKYKTDTEGKCIKTRGPVLLQPQVQKYINLNKLSNIQTLKSWTIVQNQQLLLSFKLKPDALLMSSSKNPHCQYLMKLEALPEFKLNKQHSNVLTLLLKTNADTMTKYFSTVFKKVLKTQILELDVRFESKLQRDVFIVLVNKKVNKPGSTKLPYSQQYFGTGSHSSQSPHIGISHPVTNLLPPKAQTISVPQIKNLMPSKQSKQSSQSIKQLRQTVPTFNVPQLKSQIQNLFANDPPKKQKQYLNIFQDSILSQDQPQTINLRNSFLQMQHQPPKSLKTSSIQKSNKTLQQSQSKINQLISQRYLLKQQNTNLKMQLLQSKNSRYMDVLKQRIKSLQQQNQKIIKQRDDFQQKYLKLQNQMRIKNEIYNSLLQRIQQKTQNNNNKERSKSKDITNILNNKKRQTSPTSGNSSKIGTGIQRYLSHGGNNSITAINGKLYSNQL